MGSLNIFPTILLLFLFLGLALLYSCKSTKELSEDYEGRRLSFGSGGGFTGQVYEFCLLEDGALFNVNHLKKENVHHLKVKRKKTKEMYTKLEKLLETDPACNHPGNMYQFIKVKEKDKEDVLMVWGDHSYEVAADISDLHANLMELTKSEEKK